MKERGCGTRVSGGIYAETPLSPFGQPVEFYLVDPPLPVDTREQPVSKVGVTLIERNGVTHVLDWIGEVHYPNVADFVEEVREMGLSRRLPSTLDFSLLSKESRLITIHARAYIENHERIFRDAIHVACPKELKHQKGEMCAGIWWHDVEGAEQYDSAIWTKVIPCCSYCVPKRPDGKRKYLPAIFASWPIQQITVINDPVGGTHEEAIEAASAAGLPVVTADE